MNGGYVLPPSSLTSSSTSASASHRDTSVDAAPVHLVFCNPDLLWRANYPTPRFGQGAFRIALEAVLKARTGKSYPYTQYGKPTKATYEFAERLLREQVSKLAGSDGEEGYTPRV